VKKIKKKTNQAKKVKVLVAMSGGVDSSVAAKLLKNQGYEVVGIFLHFWKENLKRVKNFNFENKCCSDKALSDARKVANKINIPLYVFDYSKIFKKQVVNNFLNEYKTGKTPNPCVRCNKLVKLGYLIKQAKKLGFDYVATGHYACLRQEFSIFNFQFSKNTNNKNIYKLQKAKDETKDQSYFLYTLNQQELKHLLFPLGDYIKTEVRQLAKKFNLLVAEKKESQEICFIPEKNHNEFLKRNLKLKPGKIKTLDNKIIGKHNGLPLYTIGQRKGVEISGKGPFYVAKTDYKTNALYVVNNKADSALYSKQLIANNINWLSGKMPKLPLHCSAVIRYHHPTIKCVVTLPLTNIKKENKIKKIARPKNNSLLVKFAKPQRAVTPGQSIVFYNNNEMLGGGVIN